MADNKEHADVQLWKDGTFHQETIDLSKYADGIIKAKVDGKWQEFKVTNLPEKFMKWNIKSRLKSLEKLKERKRPSLDGPHNAMIASYGIKRFDSQFIINNAVKGSGFIPKKEQLKKIMELLKTTIDSSYAVKMVILEDFYKNAETMFDHSKLVSLELYSTPEFETQSFLNQMTNPGVAIVYLDFPSFKVKAIAQLLHPDDPQLTDYEKDMVEYVNLIHSYFHGDFPKIFITAIYHVIEVFDNSPGKKGRGVRIIPEP